MPIPFLFGGLGVVASSIVGIVGAGATIKGTVNIKDAEEKKKKAESIYENSKRKVEELSAKGRQYLSNIEEKQLEVEKLFIRFANVTTFIKNYPDLEKLVVDTEGARKKQKTINSFSHMFSTCSTFNNSGNNGIVKSILGGSAVGLVSFGAGLLTAGLSINSIGEKKLQEADEEYNRAKNYEKRANEVCKILPERLEKLKSITEKYIHLLEKIKKMYLENLSKIEILVLEDEVEDYKEFRELEKKFFKILVNATQLLLDAFDIKILNDIEMVELNSKAEEEIQNLEKSISEVENL